VERRSPRAKRWQPVPDVIAWDGESLTLADLPESLMIGGTRWRVDGVEYRARRMSTMGPIVIRLRRMI
jgi:hypothetical protein